MTFCVECGGDNTVQSTTGNESIGSYLFAAEDLEGDVAYYSDLEIWYCNDCKEKFFK